MSTKVCPQCGTENVGVAWKCKSCGTDLSDSSPATKSPTNYRPFYAIVFGVILLIATFSYFGNVYNTTAPSEAEMNRVVSMGDQSGANNLIRRSEEAQNTRNTFYMIATFEILITGLVAYQLRNQLETEKK